MLDQLTNLQQQLAGELPTLQLPIDRPRHVPSRSEGQALSATQEGSATESDQGARQYFPRSGQHKSLISKALSEPLKHLSEQAGVPLFVTLLTGFKTLLYRYTNQDDLIVGSLTSDSSPIVLRTDLSGDPTFLDLLSRVDEVTSQARRGSALWRQEVGAERSIPLFQVMFVMQEEGQKSPQAEGQALIQTCADARSIEAESDLCVFVKETEQGLLWTWQYNSHLFLDATISRMCSHCQTLLSAIVADPNQPLHTFPLLTEAERHQLLVEWNDTQEAYPKLKVHQLFSEQAERTPDAIAVVAPPLSPPQPAGSLSASHGGRNHLTYQELNRRANQLAHYLQAKGVLEGTGIVGICVERSLEMAVGVLGILKAGAAYVPFDPAYPKDRLQFMLENSGVQVLLTTKKLLTQFPQIAQVTQGIQQIGLDTEWAVISRERASNPVSDQASTSCLSTSLAYVLYTSGSTGRPKGVAMPHDSLFNLIWWQLHNTVLEGQARTLQFSPISFDVSFQELFSTWCAGGTLVLLAPSGETRRDPRSLLRFLASNQIERLFLPFVALQQLADAADSGPLPTSLREVITAGEQLQITPAIASLFKRLPNCTLHNQYGPTETHVVTAFTLTGDAPADSWPTLPPIGRPIANAQTYILDQHLKPVPIGVPGELYLGGNCLAQGYFNRPELTKDRFIANPFCPPPTPPNSEGGETSGLPPTARLRAAELGSLRGGAGRLYKTGDLARYLPDGNIQFLGRVDHQVKIRGFRVELGEIEVTLGQHPQVREAVVTVREEAKDKRLVAYVVPDETLPKDQESSFDREQVAHWQQVWDATYSQPAFDQEATLNLLGWRDSYTGQPIPKPQMREWVDVTVERILNEQPKRVLELGCGTGMLLFRIAPHCLSYVGTDISQQALQIVSQQLHHVKTNVRLYHKTADNFDGLEEEEFDAVIINSVVELFPSMDYLVEVLQKAVQQVTPGGFVFVGDVRSYPLLEAFHASVQLHQAPDSLNKSQLRQRIAHQLNEEAQLTIDPAFFAALKPHLPQISHVQIQLRRGHYHNEMTRFRYDVILHVGKKSRTACPVRWLDWQKNDLTLPALRQVLVEDQPEVLGIKQVPNARLLAEVKLLELLASDEGAATAGELREALEQFKPSSEERGSRTGGIEPEAFWALSDQLPYTIYINWSGNEARNRYDVVCQRNEAHAGAAPASILPPQASAQRFSNTSDGRVLPEGQAWTAYANNPSKGQLRRQLEPQLRRYLGERLPEYMVPQNLVVLDALPLTPSGKINRRALPLPTTHRPELSTALVIPQTEVEELIAAAWREALQLDVVGIHDNFFELGGHSLLLTQVHNKLAEVGRANGLFGPELSIMKLFEYPTIHALAKFIHRTQAVSHSKDKTVPEQRRAQNTSRRSRQAQTTRLRQRRVRSRTSKKD